MSHGIVLLVITDGRRDCIARTVPSALANLDGPLDTRIIYDDSADPDNAEWLVDQFGPLGFVVIGPHVRQGFGGAIRWCWQIIDSLDCDFVFHCEDDFTFNRPVNLSAMAAVLDLHPNVVQLALRRQPWNDEERAAGGIVEQHPDDYVECADHFGNRWLEHRRFFTTNPSMYRSSLCAGGWPDTEHSEGMFTHRLLTNPKARFAFWGARDSGEWVTHIGTERVGCGY